MNRVRKGDAGLVARQLYYEQLLFWKNPFRAVFTIGFSVIFLLLLAGSVGNSRSSLLGGLREVQYYVPGFAAYGVMSACFNTLAISLVVRRETGVLKRLRLSPLPTWVMVASTFLSSLVVSLLEVIVLLLVGRLAFSVTLPANFLAFVVAIVVGAVCFTAMGIAASTVIPNEEAAGPIVSIVFFVLLFLSGLWYALTPSSVLAKVAGYFPVRPMILATFAPFDRLPGTSPWAWHDIAVMAIWGAAGVVVSVRRFAWEPHRSG